MSDPGSSLTQTLHKRLAQATHLLDDHVRVVQYGIYGVAALGLWRVLHSARAFSHFNRVEDIPHDFIRKNVRLTGRIRCVGTAPVSASSHGGKDTATKTTSVGVARLASSSTALHSAAPGTNPEAVTSDSNWQMTLSGDTTRHRSNHPKVSPPELTPSGNTTMATSPPRESNRVQITREVETFSLQESSLSATDSGTKEITLETKVDQIPTVKSTKETPVNMVINAVDDPKGDDADLRDADDRSGKGLAQPRSEKVLRDGCHDMGDFKPLFLEVEHVPVFQLPHHNPDQLLSLKVAAVEVPAAASEVMSLRLTNKRVWFRLLYVDASSSALVCAVTRNEFGFGAWRTLNEEIVRTGEGAVSRLADASDVYPLTTSSTLRERAKAALRALWSGAPSTGALALVDDQQAKGQEVLLGIPVAYHKLYGKLLQSEAWARKKQLGIWKEVDSRGGTNLQRSFLVRLWNRFRNLTREMKSKNN